MEFRIEWFTNALAGLCALSAVVVAIKAVFADHPRGKRRCPACWYEVHDPSAAICTECGRGISRPQDLLRTRRHWRWLWASALLFVAADSIRRIPDARSEGWTRFVPTTALILIPPVSPAQWANTHFNGSPATTSLASAFESRTTRDDLPRWQKRLMGWRLSSWSGEVVKESPRTVLAAFPSEPLERIYWQGRTSQSMMLSRCGNSPDPVIYDTRDDPSERMELGAAIGSLIERFVDAPSWINAGGGEGGWMWLESEIVVVHRPQVIAKVRRLLDVVSAELPLSGHSDPLSVFLPANPGISNEAPDPDSPRIVVYGVFDLVEQGVHDEMQRGGFDPAIREKGIVERHVGKVLEALQAAVSPDDWIDHGGDQIQAVVFGERLVVAAPPAAHLQISSRLVQLRADHWPPSDVSPSQQGSAVGTVPVHLSDAGG